MLNIDDLLQQTKGDQQSDPSQKAQISGQQEQEKLQEKLTEIKIKELEERAAQTARQAGLPYINLKGFPVAPEALRIIPENDAVQYKAVCFYTTERECKIGVVRLPDQNTAEYIQKIEGAYDVKAEIYLISEHSFGLAYKLYASLPKIREIRKGLKITAEVFENFQKKIKTLKDLPEEIKKTSISNLVTLVIASAVQARASDIHIETEEADVKIRFRIDGVLIDVAVIEKKFWEKIISRIKLFSNLKINITDRPQDGRFRIDLPKDKIDVRVSCLPTSYGESVVMRLLRSSKTGLAFEDLGITSKAFEQLKREVERPNGMIIATGPTGSGKTTTLYSILNKLNKPKTKIITLEDPIEYQLKGINQSQVDRVKGYTFSKGLRSILRQDPDVVMVGEIRDLETAEIAIQSALTGHLVVTTLHTNDAAGAIPRLISLGVKPYLLSPAINTVIAQRLVRKICPKCKKEIQLDPETLERVQKILSQLPDNSEIKVDLNSLKFFKSEGCEACQGLGYYDRIGIYEILVITPEIEKMISEDQATEYKMREIAKQQGVITMVQDGLLKAVQGITTVEEVFRVIE